ncbi:hypothetical protein CCY99_00140 [Helicobacter sp. 16-1353]|uniref:hypothetical protein n=1 Tax=Helicobacter sp. 16-1353 TaxID=2004996 RepID=UPI000DCF1B78|nr:hypothetical protein [Helicobacter sp. 16-1353]RAX55144.1 hypothetical protein CCY99_00140 [Helicobacter sp. 16-1353]
MSDSKKTSKEDSKKTFWPYGIALFLIFMVCMIILTVYIAIKSSPEDDNAYFSTRQDVDAAINDILINQKELENMYNFYIINDNKEISLERKANKKTSTPINLSEDGEFTLKLKISPKNDSVDKPVVRANITRFATSKFDKDLGILKENNGEFVAEPIILEKGEWKAMIEFSFDDKNAYFEQFILVGDRTN